MYTRMPYNSVEDQGFLVNLLNSREVIGYWSFPWYSSPVMTSRVRRCRHSNSSKKEKHSDDTIQLVLIRYHRLKRRGAKGDINDVHVRARINKVGLSWVG